MNAYERFLERIAWDPVTDCWVWTGSLNTPGYGQLSVEGRTVLVHRWSFERFVGPIPVGLQLDHLCRNRACVNPAHLEPVTAGENVRRGEGPSAVNARKPDTCPQGHPYVVRVRPDGRRMRHCARCHYDKSGNAELQRLRRQRRKDRARERV